MIVYTEQADAGLQPSTGPNQQRIGLAMASKRFPRIAQIRQLLDYNPETGAFTWRPREGGGSLRWNKAHAGRPAGWNDRLGYRAIKIFDVPFLAHRLAWAITNGVWPEVIDHINGDPSDNRISNLRSGPQEVNQRNQRRHKSNTSGRTGVHWNRFRKCWVASIKMRGTTLYLGSFDDFDSAVAARVGAEKKNGFTGRQ